MNDKDDPQDFNKFVKGLPYGADTAFGYTTVIDPTLHLRKMARQSDKQRAPSEDLNKAEGCTIDYMIKGKTSPWRKRLQGWATTNIKYTHYDIKGSTALFQYSRCKGILTLFV